MDPSTSVVRSRRWARSRSSGDRRDETGWAVSLTYLELGWDRALTSGRPSIRSWYELPAFVIDRSAFAIQGLILMRRGRRPSRPANIPSRTGNMKKMLVTSAAAVFALALTIPAFAGGSQ